MLDTTVQADGNFYVTAVMWLLNPPNRQRAASSASSALPLASVVPWGVTSDELEWLRTGTCVEQVVNSDQFPIGAGPAAIMASLQQTYNSAQAALMAQAPVLQLIGMSFGDGAWVPATIAAGATISPSVAASSSSSKSQADSTDARPNQDDAATEIVERLDRIIDILEAR